MQAACVVQCTCVRMYVLYMQSLHVKGELLSGTRMHDALRNRHKVACTYYRLPVHVKY